MREKYLIELTQRLIQKKSVTPNDDGAIDLVKRQLEEIGFKCKILKFSQEGYDDILNLYARYGNKGKNFAFAGHTDVVPAGNIKLWSHDPFAAKIVDGKIYGRGAVDMKSSIAAFISATKEFLELNSKTFKDSISFIITGDEEDVSVNGTKKIVQYLIDHNEKINHCIVGEPTNPNIMGQMVKLGRRGSISFKLTSIGKQGHVAYPHNAINPITALIKTLNLLKDHNFDNGTQYFDPTNLEITSIDTNNKSTNTIPNSATALFNIRFSSIYNSSDLISFIENTCKKTLHKYELTHHITGESFYNKDHNLSNIILSSVQKISKQNTTLSTTGGTSDARFIKEICPVMEYGLINKTAHQIDENVKIDDLVELKQTYLEILNSYFN